MSSINAPYLHQTLHKTTDHRMRIFLLAALVASTLAQDSYHCPDGWTLEEDSSGCRCFLLSGSEAVTKSDAEVLCAFHDGAWVAELDHPGINYWLKSQLIKELPVGEYGQFWLGADTEERHSPESPGNWMWQHMNESVVWFDWGDGQPNNLHGQNCITLRETHVPILPQFRDYYWNDYQCDGSAHYICEHRCFDQNGNRSP